MTGERRDSGGVIPSLQPATCGVHLVDRGSEIVPVGKPHL